MPSRKRAREIEGADRGRVEDLCALWTWLLAKRERLAKSRRFQDHIELRELDAQLLTVAGRAPWRIWERANHKRPKTPGKLAKLIRGQNGFDAWDHPVADLVSDAKQNIARYLRGGPTESASARSRLLNRGLRTCRLLVQREASGGSAPKRAARAAQTAGTWLSYASGVLGGPAVRRARRGTDNKRGGPDQAAIVLISALTGLSTRNVERYCQEDNSDARRHRAMAAFWRETEMG